MPIRRLVLWSGLLLFIVGGIVPLTWQAGTLALPLLLASAVEIFCRNFTVNHLTLTNSSVASLRSGHPYLRISGR